MNGRGCASPCSLDWSGVLSSDMPIPFFADSDLIDADSFYLFLLIPIILPMPILFLIGFQC